MKQQVKDWLKEYPALFLRLFIIVYLIKLASNL